MTGQVTIVARERRDRLGEGPVWIPEREALFWVDIEAPAVHWLEGASRRVQTRAFPEPVGWIIPRAGRRDFIVGLKSGFAVFDLDQDRLTPIGDPEPDQPDNRLNDAKVCHAGRIWAGSKHMRDAAPSGALHCLDPDLTWRRIDTGYGIANGPTFSLDGRTLYHSDSALRTIFAFDLAPDGAVANKRPFLHFTPDMGYPDGMTSDAEGCLWIAHWGGGRISRFDSDGRWIRSIAFPATNITSCAFAGVRYERLFVTSSTHGHEHEPAAGALFEVDAGVAGLPARPFAG